MIDNSEYEFIVFIEVLWLLAFMFVFHFKVIDSAVRRKLGDKYAIKIFWHTKSLKRKIPNYVNPSAGLYHWSFIADTKPSGWFEWKIHILCLATTIIGLFFGLGFVIALNVYMLHNPFVMFGVDYILIINSALSILSLFAGLTVLRKHFTKYGSVLTLCESINEDEW